MYAIRSYYAEASPARSTASGPGGSHPSGARAAPRDIPIEFESFFMEGPRYAGSAPKFSILDKLTECGAYKRENGRITVNFNAWTQNITTRLFNVYYHPNGVIRKADIKTSHN